MSDTIGAFFTAWGEADPDARKRALERVLAPHFVYADPRSVERISGIAAMSDFLSNFTAHQSGATAQVAHLDSQHGFHRAMVHFHGPDGTRMMRGQYFIETDDDNRLLRCAGFMGTGETA